MGACAASALLDAEPPIVSTQPVRASLQSVHDWHRTRRQMKEAFPLPSGARMAGVACRRWNMGQVPVVKC